MARPSKLLKTFKQIKGSGPVDPAFIKMRKGLLRVIEKHGYNLTRRLPSGFKTKMALRFGVTKNDISYALTLIRNDSGIGIPRKTNVKKTRSNDFIELCREKGYIRASKKEGAACEAIAKYLIDKVPRGGYSLLIGTPTPFCASNHPTFWNTLIVDNLVLAYVMRISSESVTIAVGTGIDATKGNRKATDWRSLDIMSGMPIIAETIYRDSFTRIITTIADKNKVCKVVLLTSGVWSGSKPSYDKYGLDLNFQTPSIDLTKAYPNLHIIALVADSHVTFSVHHVHRGKERVIYNENKKERR